MNYKLMRRIRNKKLLQDNNQNEQTATAQHAEYAEKCDLHTRTLGVNGGEKTESFVAERWRWD